MASIYQGWNNTTSRKTTASAQRYPETSQAHSWSKERGYYTLNEQGKRVWVEPSEAHRLTWNSGCKHQITKEGKWQPLGVFSYDY